MQNLKHLKLEQNKKSLNNIQHNLILQASFLFYWTTFVCVFLLFFWHDQWFKSY